MQRTSPRFRSEYFSYMRYLKKCFTQIYSDFMSVSIRMGTNMVDGNQQKHLLSSFAANVKVILFLSHEMFG